MMATRQIRVRPKADARRTRRRRSPEDARLHILTTAERLLAEGGVEAVQLRAVARRADITDAGIAHHFGDRRGLLAALIEHGGRRLRSTIDAIVAEWLGGEPAIGRLLRAVEIPYGEGYAELSVALYSAGWRDRGAPIFGKVVAALHAARLARAGSNRPTPDIVDTRLAVAAFHHALATEALFGAEFRRSAGLKAVAAVGAELQLQWWIRTIELALGLAAGRVPPDNRVRTARGPR
jgi:AcrR family transcriptional regulator